MKVPPERRVSRLREHDEEDWSERIATRSGNAAYSPDLRGIERDHAFLTRARAATMEELIALAQTCVNGPTWRQVAVARALARMPRKGAQAEGARRRG